MEQLRPVELKLVDQLFGMSSGYVLDFTNSTFAEFFRREVGINIYDDAYAIYGGSKGKRLRALLTVGQPRAISRALATLWEYRETDRIGRAQAETVVNARRRLSAVVERLGGAPLSSFDVTVEAPLAIDEIKPRNFRPDEATLRRLEAQFLALHEMSDEPQARGYHFERLLTQLFDAWEWTRAAASAWSASRSTARLNSMEKSISLRRNGIVQKPMPTRCIRFKGR